MHSEIQKQNIPFGSLRSVNTNACSEGFVFPAIDRLLVDWIYWLRDWVSGIEIHGATVWLRFRNLQSIQKYELIAIDDRSA